MREAVAPSQQGRLGDSASRVKNRDEDDTYVGTLSDLFQLSVTATGTRLRPIAGMILEHILASKPQENTRF